MVTGIQENVPKETVEALEALERRVIRHGTISRERALEAASVLTRDFPDLALELDKKPEELAPPPEIHRPPREPRSGRPPRGPRSHGPRRAPSDEAPVEPASEPAPPPGEGPSPPA